MISTYFRYIRKASTEMDDLLFLNRNKSYGAFILRRTYAKNMTWGIILSIFIFLAVLILPTIKFKKIKTKDFVTEVDVSEIPDLIIPTLQSKSRIKPSTDLQKKNKVEIKKSEYKKVVKEDPKISTSSSDSNKIDTSKSISTTPLSDTSSINIDNEFIYDFADFMPQYPGGTSSLSRFISSKLVYPNTAIQNKIEGIVVVGFVIDKEGIVRNPKIIKSLYFSCDEEALRVLKLIPIWIPAKNNNRNVSFNFKLPIEFKLNK